jgi:hypothetical protein
MNSFFQNSKRIIVFIFSFTYVGCSSPNLFYIDISKQAIISCKGRGFKRITVSNDFRDIVLV